MKHSLGLVLAVLAVFSLFAENSEARRVKSGGGTGTTVVAPVQWLFARGPGDMTYNHVVNAIIYYNVDLYGSANTSFEFYVSRFGATPVLAATVAAQNLTWIPSTCFGPSATASIPGLDSSTAYAVYVRVNKGGKFSAFTQSDLEYVTASDIGMACSWDNRPFHVQSFGYNNTMNSIEVRWQKPYDPNTVVQEYRVYLATGSNFEAADAPLVPVGVAPPPPATEPFGVFMINGLAPWSRYCFGVSTVDVNGVESAIVRNCSATFGTAPTL